MHATSLKYFFALMLLSSFLFWPLHAHATIITIDFTGRVASIGGATQFQTDVPVSIEDIVVGKWSYDTEAVFQDDFPQIQRPTTGFSFEIQKLINGTLTFIYDGSNTSLTFNYGNTTSEHGDSFVVSDHQFSGNAGSITGTEFYSTIASKPVNRPNWVPSSASMSFYKISGPPLPNELDGITWILTYRGWTADTSTT